MAVTLRGISSRVGGSGTTITLTNDVPSLTDGDLMLMVIYANLHPEDPPTVPDGWDLVVAEDAEDFYVKVYRKTANSEPSSYEIGRGVGGTSKSYAAGIVAWYSDIGDPLGIDASAHQSNASSTDRTYPGVTTTQDADGIACFGNLNINAGSTPPASMTERWDSLTSGLRIYCMTGVAGAAGPTGDFIATAGIGFNSASQCVTVAIVEAPVTYTIAAGAGAHGSISPTGDVVVAEHDDQGFTITADAGYEVADLLVDDVSVGALTSYTFSDVQSDHTIVASFAAIPRFDASLVGFLRVQGAKQEAFGTAVEPAFGLPVTFTYQDADSEQLAAWDAGVWTPLMILAQTARFATFTLKGTLFYELLPLLLAGFDSQMPNGTGPYNYFGAYVPDAVGTPVPYTFRFGGNDANRLAGSMVQIQDAYLHSLTLTFNLNDKAVMFESEWFGRFIDDNDGAGYAPVAVALPTGLTMVNGLHGTLGMQDAHASGGQFDDLTAFECALIEWQLKIDTGLRPMWAADQNALTYCGVRQEWPSAGLAAQLRTNIATYALTKVKSNARQFQELAIAHHETNRAFVLHMTGRWLPDFVARERARGEIVMKPTFQAQTPSMQVDEPHWLSWTLQTGWEH